MEKIINLTPHSITILNEEGKMYQIIGSSGVARLAQKTVIAGIINGIIITKTEFGKPEGLPNFEEGTFIIVSQLIKTALHNRKDLLVPAEVIRDKNGIILGYKSLCK